MKKIYHPNSSFYQELINNIEYILKESNITENFCNEFCKNNNIINNYSKYEKFNIYHFIFHILGFESKIIGDIYFNYIRTYENKFNLRKISLYENYIQIYFSPIGSDFIFYIKCNELLIKSYFDNKISLIDLLKWNTNKQNVYFIYYDNTIYCEYLYKIKYKDFLNLCLKNKNDILNITINEIKEIRYMNDCNWQKN